MTNTRTFLLAALLGGAGLPPAQAKGDLEHWLRLCEQPRLEYWDKLCADALGPQPDKKVARTEPAKPASAEPASSE